MKKTYIHYNGKKYYFNIPENWKLGVFAEFPESCEPVDIQEQTRKALEFPIGCPKLSHSLAASDKVAVIVEDLTRTSPKKLILEILLDELARIGIPKNQIVIVIALGTHRPVSSSDMINAFGEKIVHDYTMINHDCYADDLVAAWQLFSDTPVKINRAVAQADFVIGIGSVFPHPLNGFGGGCKIFFPGIADSDSILTHHFDLTFDSGTNFGSITGNRFYAEICRIAQSCGLNFIINSVMDPSDQACDIVAGHPVEAHQAGIQISRSRLSVIFPNQADVTIVSAFPYSEGAQIVKPLIPASMVTKQNGTIIWAVDCSAVPPEGFWQGFEHIHKTWPSNLKSGVLDYFQNKRLIMDSGAVDFNMAIGRILAMQNDYRIILVSKDINPIQAEKMGALYSQSLEHAITIADQYCQTPVVHVMPSGGIILPVLREMPFLRE